MTEMDALLRAVWLDPDDDAPRLVVADWFQENHDTNRAEFIRVQVEMERLPGGSPRRIELAARGAKLWADRHKWRVLPRQWMAGLDYRRGFLFRCRYSADDLTAESAGFWRHGPLAELEVFAESVGEIVGLAGCDALAHLRKLELQLLRVTDDDIRSLAELPLARVLAAMTVLNGTGITEAGHRLLRDAALFPNLAGRIST